MSIQLRTLRMGHRTTPQVGATNGSDRVSAGGRLLQAALAVYLIPALLVVLLVGGIGLLVLTVGQVIGRIAHGPNGPDSPATSDASR